MQKLIELKDVEIEYRTAVNFIIESKGILTVDDIIDLSLKFFDQIKVIGASDTIEPATDMLLFQYGVYDWGDEKGEHANFDITRQFILRPDPEEDYENFYQLSLSLIYDPTSLDNVDSYNSWSIDFPKLHDWSSNIKSTSGYKKLKLAPSITHNLLFTDV